MTSLFKNRLGVLLGACLLASGLGIAEANAQSGWSAWRPFGNAVRIEQRGDNNGAAVAQSGEANRAGVVQNGVGLTGIVRQNGDDNRALLFQRGRGSNAAITQNGSSNRMCLAQVGDNLDAEVVQNGGDRGGIWVQTPSGVREHRSFGGRLCY